MRSLGIRGRLFLAFGALVAMTVIASVVSWLVTKNYQSSLTDVVENKLPLVAIASSLADKGGVISATAPLLLAAEGESERARVWTHLTDTLGEMRNLIHHKLKDFSNEKITQNLQRIVDLLALNLQELDKNVRKSFWFEDKVLESTTRLRWAHADFLDEVEPMINDAQFSIGLTIRRMKNITTEAQRIPRSRQLEKEITRQEALSRINASGNLIVSLLARVSGSESAQEITATQQFLSEIVEPMQGHFNTIKALPSALSLRQAADALLSFAEGQNSVFTLQRDKIEVRRKGYVLLTRNREWVVELQKNINDTVKNSRQRTARSANATIQTMENGKWLLLFIGLFSVLVAFGVIWFYVGRNLVRRICELDTNMRDIAQGDLQTVVRSQGNDEIATMARSLSTFRDTLKDTQEELVQAGKLAALGQLSAGIAHEMNQPLTAIRSYARNASVFIEKDRLPSAHENMQRISDLTGKMAAMVNRFKNLARRSSFETEAVKINKIIEDATTLLKSRFDHEQVILDLSLPDQDIRVQAEAIRLEQVFVNLLTNALDAVLESTKKTIAVSVRKTEQVEISVADSGTGIPSAEKRKVFDPFFTTKEVGAGLGLGLTITYNIIKDFGGRIRIRPSLLGGAEFIVTLPGSRSGNRVVADL